jgi:hypothetical protein
MTCRHWHIADVATYLSESVKKLTSDNAAAQFEVLQSSKYFLIISSYSSLAQMPL